MKLQNKVKQHTVYKLASGKRVCGVTTITGLLNKPQLLSWANRIGLDGIEMNAYKDDLANVGTLAHAMIISHLTGEKLDTNEYSHNDIDRAENAMVSFLEWHKNNPIEVKLSEQPLISEKYQFGGTPDIYGTLNGERVLIDLKTGSGIYKEMGYQLGGYVMLLEENGYGVDRAYILRVGREESEGFEVRSYPKIEVQKNIFKLLLGIYDALKKEKKGGVE